MNSLYSIASPFRKGLQEFLERKKRTSVCKGTALCVSDIRCQCHGNKVRYQEEGSKRVTTYKRRTQYIYIGRSLRRLKRYTPSASMYTIKEEKIKENGLQRSKNIAKKFLTCLVNCFLGTTDEPDTYYYYKNTSAA